MPNHVLGFLNQPAPDMSALRKTDNKLKLEINSTPISALQRPQKTMTTFSCETDDAMESTITIIRDDLVDLQTTKFAPSEPRPSVKNQNTIFTSSASKSVEKTTDPSLKQVLDAVAELNLKVDNIAQQHRTFELLAMEDGEARKSLSAMKSRKDPPTYRIVLSIA